MKRSWHFKLYRGLALGLLYGALVPVALHGADKPLPQLPGVQRDGTVLLPNQWSLRPAGRQVPLGDFPVNIAIHPSQKWFAVLHAGFGDHEIVTLDATTLKVLARVVIDQAFYGLCISPDGNRLFASGGEYEVVHSFACREGQLSDHRQLKIADDKWIPAGLACSADGRRLFVAGTWGHGMAVCDLAQSKVERTVATGKESYPYACLPLPDGKRVLVSLWAQSRLAVIDVDQGRVAGEWRTKEHPTEMCLSADGATLYVACANSTLVSVLDAASGRELETINCALYPRAPVGNTPNSLCLAAEGKLLLVANADANNLAVINVAERGQAKPLGFVPVGWYPTSVRYLPERQQLLVANGKGLISKSNTAGPNPNRVVDLNLDQYIGALYKGCLTTMPLPSPEQLAKYSQRAYRCSPLREDLAVTEVPEAGNPIPRRVGDPSPIKYCIYIIKENRTYDQVFGDMPEGNGDPNLCLFPEQVTPNHHRLARQFVLLDNFYVDGEVSADGHEWSMGAYATDYVEKVWPLNYRDSEKRKIGYTSEGENELIARPAKGYIWDRCAEAGVSYFSFGEWIENHKDPNGPGRALSKNLEGHFDPLFRSFDLDYMDIRRADRFIAELGRFEREGQLPQFIVMRLPSDHNSGSDVGKPTPTVYMADNDLALGRVIEAITKSKFWPETAIFVVEDDAQNGPDHVDAHRSVALVISPYTKRGFVDSAMYSTTSMLRSMELILGLEPMSQFDAAARPMFNSFQAARDLGGYTHVVPNVDMEAKNGPDAWGAELSATFDFSKEDAVDDLLFNEVIWRNVKGADQPMPAPVRAAFVLPHEEDDDEDEEAEEAGE
ncbi:MAG: SMP-30/gluconolactonase/LRE family protein [Pirellulales bacterium]|nr:SMP-30/gluconolactonase/LRE family protein [Pirellulales bacterium]